MGLKRMSSPVTARSGILWAGAGMLLATLVSFFYPGMSNYELIIAAIVVGSSVAWWSGRRVAMTDMPQMIALYNGMGGGAAAAIAAVELYRFTTTNTQAKRRRCGAGSRSRRRNHRRGILQWQPDCICQAAGAIRRSLRFSGQQVANVLLLIATLAAGAVLVSGDARMPSSLL